MGIWDGFAPACEGRLLSGSDTRMCEGDGSSTRGGIAQVNTHF